MPVATVYLEDVELEELLSIREDAALGLISPLPAVLVKLINEIEMWKED